MKASVIGLASLGIALISSGMAQAAEGLTQTVYHNYSGGAPAYTFVNTNDAFQYNWNDNSMPDFFGADAAGDAKTDNSRASQISFTATGYLDVLKAGDYTFTMFADDYGNIQVDGASILSGSYHSESTTQRLGVGYHPIELDYSAGGEPNGFIYTLTAPDGRTTANGVAGVSDDVRYTTSISAAPEPSEWAMMIAGVALMGAALRYGQRRGWSAAAA